MEVVTRKAVVQIYLDKCTAAYAAKGLSACVQEVSALILSKKVKFPLLEYAAHTLFQVISDDEQLAFCDQIESLRTEGGNVLLGIVLQNRLSNHFEESIQKATEYISNATIWYVCDIIGERVYGYALLLDAEKTIPVINLLSNHHSHWVVRATGAGIHYAIKKGLEKEMVQTLFPILLARAKAPDKEIRQGIGWAAKTTARFHPDIIAAFHREIDDPAKVANWFRAKIDIGLNRHHYAKGN